MPGYGFIALGALGGKPGRQEASYEWKETDGKPLHLLEEAISDKGKVYRVLFVTPASDWDSTKSTRDTVLGSFRPS